MIKKQNSPGIINKKLELYCAYQERCTKDIVSKLKDWNIRENQIETIIEKLKKDNFLSEDRFAKAYARGKFRVNKWGKQRIAFELHLKNIPAHLIQGGLNEIDETEYHETLNQLIMKKKNELLKGKNPGQTTTKTSTHSRIALDAKTPGYEINQEKNLNVREKIINFAHNKGFEMNLILEIVNELKI